MWRHLDIEDKADVQNKVAPPRAHEAARKAATRAVAKKEECRVERRGHDVVELYARGTAAPRVGKLSSPSTCTTLRQALQLAESAASEAQTAKVTARVQARWEESTRKHRRRA